LAGDHAAALFHAEVSPIHSLVSASAGMETDKAANSSAVRVRGPGPRFMVKIMDASPNFAGFFPHHPNEG
jgi:hypothetical protein